MTTTLSYKNLATEFFNEQNFSVVELGELLRCESLVFQMKVLAFFHNSSKVITLCSSVNRVLYYAGDALAFSPPQVFYYF